MLNPEKLFKEKIKDALPKMEKEILKELGYEEIEVFEEKKIEIKI